IRTATKSWSGSSASSVRFLPHTPSDVARMLAAVGKASVDDLFPTVPASLRARAEFATSYTPYQPEVSQGTLQASFEFQTYVARLAGLDVANSSMYDGASA